MIPIYKPYKIKNSKSVLSAIEEGWISSQGRFINEAIEKLKNMLECKNVILTCNGTSATHCIVLALKYKYPDIKKIYVPNNVYVAAINSVLYEYPLNMLELLPINLETLNIDMTCIRFLEKNSALLIVHNVGRIIDVPLIRKIRPDLVIIEDICEAFMASYPNGKKVGTCSLGASVSFFANKTITSGEGGAFITNDDDVYKHIKLVSNQGQTEKRYLHCVKGYNYRMTNIEAAYLVDQLELYEEIITRKKAIFSLYENTSITMNQSYWLYCCKIINQKSYEEVESYFKTRGIEIRPMFYPITYHDHLKDIKRFDFTNDVIAARVNRDYFMFPSYPDLTDEQVLFIKSTIDECRTWCDDITYIDKNINCKDVEFLLKNLTTELEHFRYYNGKDIQTRLENHLKTIIVKDGENYVGYGHIHNDLSLGVVVKNEYQKRGIGKTVVKKLLSSVEGEVWLEVDCNNINAQFLYESLGFTKQERKDTVLIYRHNNSVSLPTSIGEVVDKYTILQIKSENIKDEVKLTHINVEKKDIFKHAEKYINGKAFWCRCLYNLNKTIWIAQDKFRENPNPELAQEIIYYNDARFRVKNMFNINSKYKEQKGYTLKKLFLLSHLGLGDMFTMNGAVRYLSLFYDEIIILSQAQHINTVSNIYKDDQRIKIVDIESEKFTDTNYQQIMKKYRDNGYECRGCGVYDGQTTYVDLQKCIFYIKFYIDLGLDFKIFREYAYIYRDHEAESQLYSDTVKEAKYIFSHEKNNWPCIQSDLTVYKPQPEIPLLHYCKIMENAAELHLIDSSFSCLAVKLNLKAKRKVIYTKNYTAEYYSEYFKDWEIIN